MLQYCTPWATGKSRYAAATLEEALLSCAMYIHFPKLLEEYTSNTVYQVLTFLPLIEDSPLLIGSSACTHT